MKNEEKTQECSYCNNSVNKNKVRVLVIQEIIPTYKQPTFTWELCPNCWKKVRNHDYYLELKFFTKG